ncbi:hypothetical protein [Enterobacter asburiae]|uniref:hypothetical protein n=1 Tax=Enterobacter asburiae TaxID=61645 RepID=UPI003F577DCA
MTNNKLTDERIESIACGSVRQSQEEGMWMARELQACRKAAVEPVADVVAWSSRSGERKCDIRWRRFDVAPGPLFTSPQSMLVAPEIVPDELRDEIIDLCAGYEIGDQGAQEIWEACRAVMFASSSQEVTP